MVVFGHAGKVLQVGRHLPFGSGVIDCWGPVGVTVFFVISGYLITRLLLEEQRASGKISLRGFYLRRAFRILPAYWAYLVVIALLASAGLVAAGERGLAHALSFTTDYVNPESWVLNHSWSLSVEEQFYLLWPLAVVLLGALRARRTALCLVLAAPLVRVATFFLAPQLRPAITSMLHLRIDALMVGCWAALEQDARPASRVLGFLERPASALGAAVYCVFVAACVRRFGDGSLQSALGYTLEAVSACALVLWAISHSASRAGRVLNWAPLARLGVISYSLYLWQQLWLSHEKPTPAWMVPLLIAGIVLCAELSYRLVEAPLLRLRSRLLSPAPSTAIRQLLPS